MSGRIVHTVTNGWCSVCGENEEWLQENGATIVYPDPLPKGTPR